MTRSIIAALLDKYWQTETTVEEEKILAEFFRGETVPAEWESYKALFAYYKEEGELTTSADFDKRLLERITAAGLTAEIAAPDAFAGPTASGSAAGLTAAAVTHVPNASDVAGLTASPVAHVLNASPVAAASDPNTHASAAQDRPPGRIRSLNRHAPWWAAAAVIILSLSAALMTSHPGSPAGSPSTRPELQAGTQISSTTIKDTYDDPQQALAAIRKALFKASSKINTGRSITKKELTHFNQLQHALSY